MYPLFFRRPGKKWSTVHAQQVLWTVIASRHPLAITELSLMHASSTLPQNTTQKSISIVFSVSAIRHDSSLSKYRKQKQSPPGTTTNGERPGGWLLLFTVLAEWRIMTTNAYAKNNGDGLLCSILWYWCCIRTKPFVNFIAMGHLELTTIICVLLCLLFSSPFNVLHLFFVVVHPHV
jgi:hypothetical protein